MDEEWPDEAYEALVNYFPGLDVMRGPEGRVVVRDEAAVYAAQGRG